MDITSAAINKLILRIRLVTYSLLTRLAEKSGETGRRNIIVAVGPHRLRSLHVVDFWWLLRSRVWPSHPLPKEVTRYA
jgi:hypothetical protein